ncbi:MAG: ribosomal protein S18-alanine N-acetyltransferase [Betaproteobacteria bacterium]|nr:ribosomal protein S18-alanine N-acetyltransferase [Betaproteobacteria bacterium]
MSALWRTAPDLRPMELSDLDTVSRIEQAAYAFPWSRGNFADSLDAGYDARCAWDGRTLLGYYVCMPVLDEMHLLNLTVALSYQGKGWGRWLLGEVHAAAQRAGAGALWLEVRPSNHAAIRLYERHGFARVGVRRAYYPAAGATREDALLMRLDLDDSGAQR